MKRRNPLIVPSPGTTTDTAVSTLIPSPHGSASLLLGLADVSTTAAQATISVAPSVVASTSTTTLSPLTPTSFQFPSAAATLMKPSATIINPPSSSPTTAVPYPTRMHPLQTSPIAPSMQITPTRPATSTTKVANLFAPPQPTAATTSFMQYAAMPMQMPMQMTPVQIPMHQISTPLGATVPASSQASPHRISPTAVGTVVSPTSVQQQHHHHSPATHHDESIILGTPLARTTPTPASAKSIKSSPALSASVGHLPHTPNPMTPIIAAAPASSPSLHPKSSVSTRRKASSSNSLSSAETPSPTGTTGATLTVASARPRDRSGGRDRSRDRPHDALTGSSSSAPQADKQKKRLLRKAELARASRRRKKAYVTDLEEARNILMAQNAFLLSVINKMPSLAAEIEHQRLPSGLTLEYSPSGIASLRCHIEMRAEDSEDEEQEEEQSEGDEEANGHGRQHHHASAQASPLLHQQYQSQQHSPHSTANDLAVLAHLTDSTHPAPPRMPVEPMSIRSAVIHPHAPSSVGVASVGSARMIPSTNGRSPRVLPTSSILAGAYAMSPNSHMAAMPMYSQHLSGDSPVSMSLYRTPNEVTHNTSMQVELEQEPPTPIGVKAFYKGEWRRFTILSTHFTYDHLLDTLYKLLFPGSANGIIASPITIKYIDTDGDSILIQSTNELHDAYHCGVASESAAAASSSNSPPAESTANGGTLPRAASVTSDHAMNGEASAATHLKDCMRLYVSHVGESNMPPPLSSISNIHKRKSVSHSPTPEPPQQQAKMEEQKQQPSDVEAKSEGSKTKRAKLETPD